MQVGQASWPVHTDSARGKEWTGREACPTCHTQSANLMSEEHRQRTIRLKLSRMEDRAPGVIPTGSDALNAALGIGGIPRGRIAELFGPSGGGKTRLALRTVARLQELGLNAAWIDADRTFDPTFAAELGVSLERLAVALPSSAEEALEIGRRLALSGGVDLVAFDSAAALVPQLELEAGVGDSGPGLQARVLASGLRRLASALTRAGCSALFLNQTRGRAGALEPETTAGGPPLRLYAAVRIALTPAHGGAARFRIVKNKVAAAFGEGPLEAPPDQPTAERP